MSKNSWRRRWKDGVEAEPLGVGSRNVHPGARKSQIKISETETILRRGRTLEHLGCFREALELYDGAVAWRELDQSPFDTGRILHRVGSCARIVGDGGRAFAAFVAAAREARNLGLSRPCGESLAAAGACLLAFPPSKPISEEVDNDLARSAFYGVLGQTRETLLDGDPPSLAAAMKVHDRFANLVVLCAFAALERAPSNAAKALYHLNLTPFMERYCISDEGPIDDAFAVAFVVKGLAGLCASVAEQGRQHRLGVEPTGEAVASLVRDTANAFQGPKQQRMLLWAAEYLREHRNARWVTDEHVHALALG